VVKGREKHNLRFAKLNDLELLSLHVWLCRQLEDRLIEPNSSLGAAISYMLKHWERLTLFLRVPGATLDNNICERALKRAILHRKNALFYKTGRGAIIMLHDSGGDRAETVAALPEIIQRLKAKGYRFATVTEALKLAAGDVPVSRSQQVVGTTLVYTQQAADKAVAVLAVALITMTVLTVLRLLSLVGFAVAQWFFVSWAFVGIRVQPP